MALFGCREAQKWEILLDLVVGLKKKKKKKKKISFLLLCQLGMCCDVSLCGWLLCGGGGVVQVLTIASGKLL